MPSYTLITAKPAHIGDRSSAGEAATVQSWVEGEHPTEIRGLRDTRYLSATSNDLGTEGVVVDEGSRK